MQSRKGNFVELWARILDGDIAALSQLITQIEDDIIDIPKVMKEIYSRHGHSYSVGITGAPGLGKSTLIDKLTTILRRENLSVGIVMVDPSSPISGGALLGDRTRLRRHYLDDAVYIRSMATRGKLGGLSKKTRAVVKLLDSFGKDIIVIETAGIGQAEVDVTEIADTTILALVPHTGDIIQVMKAGIIEKADIFVINKCDLGEADHLAVDLDSVLRLRTRQDGWSPPIVKAEAVKDVGIDEIYKAIELHREFLNKEGLLLKYRRRRLRKEFTELTMEKLLGQLSKFSSRSKEVKTYLARVETGEVDPYSACEEMFADDKIQKALLEGLS